MPNKSIMSNSNSKLNRVRRLLSEAEIQVLADPTSSQDERLEALANREANKRQTPLHSRAERDLGNGMNNLLPADRAAVEQEMLNQPTSAHGYPTSPGSYEEYGTYEVTTRPRAITRNGNITNFGFPSEAGDRARKLDRAIRVQDVLRKHMDPKSLGYVTNVKQALGRQVASGMVNPATAFQRYAVTNAGTYTQEQLVLIGLDMKVLNERYDSTAGQWVVPMPFKAPNTPEEIRYNLVGIDGENGAELHKKQIARYDANFEDAKARAPRQVPPAKRDMEDNGLKYYRAGDQRSQRSLKNPRRGDDYIRNSRIKAALGESKTNVIIYPSEPKKPEKSTLPDKVDLKTKMHKNAMFREGQVMMQMTKEIKEQTARLDSPHSWIREDAMRNLKALKNKLTSLQKQKDMRAKSIQDDRADIANVNSYAEGLSRMCDSNYREKVIEEQSYQRHLNLLEDAKRILSQGSSSKNLFG
jgi:hypothetical protein